MKKWIQFKALFFVCLLTSLFFAGCGRNAADDSEYALYCLNNQKTKIVSQAYEPEASDTEGLIEEFIARMCEDTADADYQNIFPENVTIERYEYENNQLQLYFNAAYSEIPSSEEILTRGAVVHTMMQIDGVRGVSLYVDNQPLKNAKGEDVGILTNDSFVENPGEKINNIQEADLTLYFASEAGDGLVRESQHVYYSSNTSIEKLVMEQLLDGPRSSNARSAIPEGTGLVSVSVMDGVCLVNLDDGFLSQNFEINESVVIYSIVDSLAELDTVNTVQIAVNGKTNITYREKLSLEDSYQQNLDLVVEEGEDVEVVQNQEREGLLDPSE